MIEPTDNGSDSLMRKINLLEATIAQKEEMLNQTRMELIDVRRELSTIKQREAILVEALDVLARLGNGDRFGNSIGNKIAQEALSISAPYAEQWLAEVKAKELDDAADWFNLDYRDEAAAHYLHRIANELRGVK